MKGESMSIALSRRELAVLLGGCVFVALVVALGVPIDAYAGRLQEIGKNAKQEITGTVGQIFLAALACTVVFLWWKRLYGELMVTGLVGAFVAWVVFSPDGVSSTLRGIANDIFA
jgi:hypothetical protein